MSPGKVLRGGIVVTRPGHSYFDLRIFIDDKWFAKRSVREVSQSQPHRHKLGSRYQERTLCGCLGLIRLLQAHLMSKWLFLLTILLTAPTLEAQATNRVRCSWLVGVVAYFNSATDLLEAQGLVIEGVPEGDAELAEILAAAADRDIPVYRLDYSSRVVSPDERIEWALGTLGSIKQGRNFGPVVRASDVPRNFYADPTKPKVRDEGLVNARLEILQSRLRQGLQKVMKGEPPPTLLAPPLIVKEEHVYDVASCFIRHPEVGVASFRNIPRIRMRSGALKCSLSMGLMLPFMYMGAQRQVSLPFALTGIGLGSVPGWMGLWDGVRAHYEFIRNRFASDNIDIGPFEQFAIRATLGRATPGQVFWLYGKEKGPWEVDLVIFIGQDNTPILLSVVTRDGTGL